MSEQTTFSLSSRSWTIAVAAFSAIMMTLDITIVNVALPAIGSDLGLSLDGAQWVVNAYGLAFAALLLTAGSASDRYGRRGIFIAGHLIFLSASLACMSADSELFLIVFRGFQGIGAALVFGTTIPLIADSYLPDEESQRTRAIAVAMSVSGVAVALGPVIGGFIVDTASWRWIFAVNIPISLFIIIATVLKVPDLHRMRGHRKMNLTPPTDYFSAALVITSLFALNYSLLAGPVQTWTAPVILFGFAISFITFLIFIIRQYQRGSNAMVDLKLFLIPTFSSIVVVAFALRMFSFGLFPFLVFWLSGAAKLSPLATGATLLFMAVPMLAVAMPASLLIKWFSVGHILAAGLTTVGCGLILGLNVSANSSWTALVPAFVVIGIGSGITFPYLMDVAVAVVPPTRAGTATGIANTAFPLGTASGIALYGILVTGSVESSLADAPHHVRELVVGGQLDSVGSQFPQFLESAKYAYAEGLHSVFIFASVAAFVAAVACALGIREKDRWVDEATTSPSRRDSLDA